MTGPQPVAKAEVVADSGGQAEPLLKAGSSRIADGIFHVAMLACGLCVLALVGVIIYELISGSKLSWHAFGLKFFFQSEWDPVNEQFGALPFVYGTLVSSLLALLIAVPLAVGVAVFITEMSPRWLKGPLAFTTARVASAISACVQGIS